MSDKINQIVCFDFETGGFKPTKNPATEIALISFRADTFEELERYETYIQPYDEEFGLEYQKQALEFTGITMSDLESGKHYKDVVADIISFLKNANTGKHSSKKPVLLGHNVGFDIGFLTFLFDCAGKYSELSKLLQSDEDHKGQFIVNCEDTMREARKMWPVKGKDIKDHKLETCCDKAGIELDDAHKAINDVIGTKDLFAFFVNSLRSTSASNNVAEVQQGQPKQKQRLREEFQF